MIKYVDSFKLIIFSSILLYNSSFGINISIPKDLQPILSINITDSTSSKPIYSHNNNSPRLIASNVKLFTTVFALQSLGPDFHWNTQLRYSGTINNHVLNGNLYLQGGGDPSLDNADLYQIISSLNQLDINTINGNIILDSSIFNSDPAYSMLQTDPFDVDKILPSGLIINGNRVRITIQVINNKITIGTYNLYGINLINKLQLDSQNTSCDLDNTIKPSINESNFVLSGIISPKCNHQTTEYNIFKNFAYNKMIINQVFADLNLKINGEIQSGITPTSTNLIYSHKSPSLAQILIDMNKYSNNLYAMTLVSSVGAFKTTNTDTFANGAKLYYTFLKDNQLLDPKLKLENGSGLSRHEYFTASQVSHLLHMSDISPLGIYLAASLPTPLGDGTLHNKFTQFANRLYVKTGTLNDVQAYSGYLYAKNKHKYSIVIIANDVNNSTQKEEISKLVNSIFEKIDNIK